MVVMRVEPLLDLLEFHNNFSSSISTVVRNVLAFSHSRGLSSGKSMRHDIEETNTSFPAVNDSNSQLWGFGSNCAALPPLLRLTTEICIMPEPRGRDC